VGRPKQKYQIKRVQVTFTKEQYDLIQKLKGELGISDSEVVRNIVIAWLAEKGIISEMLKEKLSGKGDIHEHL